MDTKTNNFQRIKTYYENSRGDSTELFREILRVSNEIGMKLSRFWNVASLKNV